MKRPFVYLLASLVAGIVFFHKLEINFSYIMILTGIFLLNLILTVKIKKGFSIALLIVIFLVSGVVLYSNTKTSFLLKNIDKPLKIEGTIIKELKEVEEYSNYILRVSRIDDVDREYNLDESTLFRVFGPKDLSIGDKVQIDGVVKIPSRNTNPGLFSYRDYLLSYHIATTISVENYKVVVFTKNNPPKIQLLPNKFKTFVTETLDNSLDKGNSSIMKSIILGDDSYLEESTRKEFRDLGIAHVLAVSGLHIGIIYGFIMKIFQLLRINKKIAKVVSISLIWMYGYLIGYPPSVLRASAMFSGLILSSLIHRRYDSLNILSLVAFILLLKNPIWILSPGFQFSFVATGSLIQ